MCVVEVGYPPAFELQGRMAFATSPLLTWVDLKLASLVALCTIASLAGGNLTLRSFLTSCDHRCRPRLLGSKSWAAFRMSPLSTATAMVWDGDLFLGWAFLCFLRRDCMLIASSRISPSSPFFHLFSLLSAASLLSPFLFEVRWSINAGKICNRAPAMCCSGELLTPRLDINFEKMDVNRWLVLLLPSIIRFGAKKRIAFMASFVHLHKFWHPMFHSSLSVSIRILSWLLCWIQDLHSAWVCGLLLIRWVAISNLLCGLVSSLDSFWSMFFVCSLAFPPRKACQSLRVYLVPLSLRLYFLLEPLVMFG